MLARIAGQLKSAQKISVVIHRDPDGDAIGSASALAEALIGRGQQVEVVCLSPIPAIFRRIVGELPTRKTLDDKTDLLVLLDCSDFGRSGFSRQLRLLAAAGRTVISLDHHRRPAEELVARPKKVDDQPKDIFVDSRAAATTEIVFRLLGELHVPITPSLATALLLGLYTDTGAFSHVTTTTKTFQLASRLVYYGANLNLISQTLCRQLPKNHQRLWGLVLAELEMNNYGIVTARVTKEHFRQTRTEPEALLGLANVLALTEEARAALVWMETDDGYRGVLRSRHASVNLGRLARLLGGTGRPSAAGFTATKALFSGKIE